jgi:hypothetical protein
LHLAQGQTFVVLHMFSGRDGRFPLSPKKNGGWSETVLHRFGTNSGDGSLPAAALTLDAAGNLYGTTQVGGTNNEGTVFELIRQKEGTFAEKDPVQLLLGRYVLFGRGPTNRRPGF